MKIKQIVTLLLLLYAGLCAGQTPVERDKKADSLPVGKLIDSVVCKADRSQTYALYIPAKGNGLAMPVVYFFDPHGSGAFPLGKYTSLADKYGFIIIGSNNSKNGNDWTTTEAIWVHLWDDTQSRLKINRGRVYTCGFSGGAKVAGYVAIQHPGIKGVIANGAGLPDGTPAGNFNFSFTAIAGEGDLNIADLASFSNELDKTLTRHHFILFDGKHEWAPLAAMDMAFAGLQLDALRPKLTPGDDAFINRYIAASKKRVNAFYKSNRLVKAADECKLATSFLDGLTGEVGWFKAKAASLAGNAIYRQQRQAQETLLVTEQNMKQGYVQHLQQVDMRYWTSTIHDLQTRAHAKTAESAMCQRLLAWLSLVFYSYSNRLINSQANDDARYFVELYKIADPTNSEAWYFSAILYARNKQVKAAENDLMKAAGYGFRDKSRLLQQPEFQQLSPGINFAAIEKRMQGPY